MADLNLLEKDVADKVPALRAAFNATYVESNRWRIYDPRDLQRFVTDDCFAACFLRMLNSCGDVPTALAFVDKALRFRKSMRLNDLKEDDFPAEMTSRQAMYYRGTDKDGHPILYIDAKLNTADGAREMALLKKYIAFHFDLHYRHKPGQMCVVLVDMSGASTSSINIEIIEFIIDCFASYFPAYLAYMVIYEMPVLLTASWKMVSAILTSKQNQKLRMASKRDIMNFIHEEHLWEHMKC